MTWPTLVSVCFLFVVMFPACGCGGTIAGECPETASKPCLTGKVCTHDATKGCDMCYCDTPDAKEPLVEDRNAVGKNPLSPP